MHTLRALIIGINTYHPDSAVDNLEGCINDANQFESFLIDHYSRSNLEVCKLIDEQATRKGILQSFENFLIRKAQPGDTILFYFAGHGSYTKSAIEFSHYDAKTQDETLVCYDSRCLGKFDLADKELAVSLSRLPQGTHIVVITDCCHATSMTRSVDKNSQSGKERFTKGRDGDQPRSLDTYLLGHDPFYVDQLEHGSQVRIPRSKHILFAACGREQKARETSNGEGLFSSVLLKELRENHLISYADLLVKVRHRIKKLTDDQLPTLEPSDGFNPNQLFLTGIEKSGNSRHLIHFYNGKWRFHLGAIHGLPTNKNEYDKIVVRIFPVKENKYRKNFFWIAEVGAVLLQDSVLNWLNPPSSEFFYGRIHAYPIEMPVRLKGAASNINKFLQIYNLSPSPFLLFFNSNRQSKYTISLEIENQLSIRNTKTNDLIHGVSAFNERAINYISTQMNKIQNWERLKDLQNNDTLLHRSIEWVFIDESTEGNPIERYGEIINMSYLSAFTESDDNKRKINYYTIKVRNLTADKVFVSLLHLSTDFSIDTFSHCIEIPGKSDWITLDDSHGLYIDDEAYDQVVDIFQLIICTESFDNFVFNQSGFARGKIVDVSSTILDRAIISRKNSALSSDWCTHKIIINTVRKR